MNLSKMRVAKKKQSTIVPENKKTKKIETKLLTKTRKNDLKPVPNKQTKNPRYSDRKKKENLSQQTNMTPFKLMKKIRSFSGGVSDFAVVRYPDGKSRIISCSERAKKLRVYNIQDEKFEDSISKPNQSTCFSSVHFFKEQSLLLTLDNDGFLHAWRFFPPDQPRIISSVKIANDYNLKKKVKISPNYADLRVTRIIQVSNNEFVCCVSVMPMITNIYKLNFVEKNNRWKRTRIYPVREDDYLERVFCVHQSILQKKMILFAGGNSMGYDFRIRYIDITKHKKKNLGFQNCHNGAVRCLTSYVTEKNEEIVVSGGNGGKIILWSIYGDILKQIQVQVNKPVESFLYDYSRKRVLFVSGGGGGCSLFSLSWSQKTHKVKKIVEKIHCGGACKLGWVDNTNDQFISCSDAAKSSVNIFKMVGIVVLERIKYLRESDPEENCSKKNMFCIKMVVNKAFIIQKPFLLL